MILKIFFENGEYYYIYKIVDVQNIVYSMLIFKIEIKIVLFYFLLLFKGQMNLSEQFFVRVYINYLWIDFV